MKARFLSLGRQPLANGFLANITEAKDEFFYDMNVVYDNETHLVSLENFVRPELMFNEHYAYHGSMSQTMQDHFKELAAKINKEINPSLVLEIGSNDGVFIKNFTKKQAIAVEPCSNFAAITNKLGYETYDEFWSMKLAKQIELEYHSKVDFIFAANCMCHIPDIEDAFKAVAHLLDETKGVFCFEDPSLLEMLIRGSYDQIYDEHAHIFSITALNKLLKNVGLEIFDVEQLSVHGGSNRIWTQPITGKYLIKPTVEAALLFEKVSGLTNFSTYVNFAKRVQNSGTELFSMLREIKKTGKKVICYGAASKTTTIFNYCNIGPDLIEYMVDTTPSKVGKLSPGKHIPIVHPKDGFDTSVKFAFLGAWNFAAEICDKEKLWLAQGGKFITHVPNVRIL